MLIFEIFDGKTIDVITSTVFDSQSWNYSSITQFTMAAVVHEGGIKPVSYMFHLNSIKSGH